MLSTDKALWRGSNSLLLEPLMTNGVAIVPGGPGTPVVLAISKVELGTWFSSADASMLFLPEVRVLVSTPSEVYCRIRSPKSC